MNIHSSAIRYRWRKCIKKKKEFAKLGCPCPRNHGVFPKPCPGHGGGCGWDPRWDGCCLCPRDICRVGRASLCRQPPVLPKTTVSRYFGSYPQHHFLVAKFSQWKTNCSHCLHLEGRGWGCSADTGSPAQLGRPWPAVPQPVRETFGKSFRDIFIHRKTSLKRACALLSRRLVINAKKLEPWPGLHPLHMKYGC